MKIGVVGSMHAAKEMLWACQELQKRGHQTFISGNAEEFLGKTTEEVKALQRECQLERDAIREFWRKMQNTDAILVINIEKHGIPHYIGGNTLMEIGFAHVLGQKIFLWNPIPDIPYYRAEIEAARPVIVHQDISKVS